jgi:hypothetical protein
MNKNKKLVLVLSVVALAAAGIFCWRFRQAGASASTWGAGGSAVSPDQVADRLRSGEKLVFSWGGWVPESEGGMPPGGVV